MVKLWVDGRKLAMTSFKVQKLAGSSWVSATKYEMNQKYRFRACFHNLFGSGIPSDNRACELNDIYMTEFSVYMKLPFAKFSVGDLGGNRMSVCLTRSVGSHGDFNDGIAPSRSRYFEFGDFTWTGPATLVANAPVEIQVLHREVYRAGYPDTGRVLPNIA